MEFLIHNIRYPTKFLKNLNNSQKMRLIATKKSYFGNSFVNRILSNFSKVGSAIIWVAITSCTQKKSVTEDFMRQPGGVDGKSLITITHRNGIEIRIKLKKNQILLKT